MRFKESPIMWSRILLWIVLLTACAGSAHTIWVRAGRAEEGSAPVRRALLIGINHYKALPNLQGSINDIETMRQILVTRWGFNEQQIAIVKDEAATRAGILAALEQLVRESGPEDTVYLHYSGHGSQVKDLNGDEKDDELDETIVPQDGRTEGVPDITDDELNQIFARLRARSALIVLDSCHSGTATRGVEIHTRSIPPDTRLDLYRPSAVTHRGVVPQISERYVLMTGAAAHQPALDGPVDGRYHGLFTYALGRSLSTAKPNATLRDVFAGAEQELKRVQIQIGRSSMPEPQLESPRDRLDMPFFAAPVALLSQTPAPTPTARLPWVEVKSVGNDRIILVQASQLGATPQSVWAIYPSGERTFAPGQAIAQAVVTEMQGNDALAVVDPGLKINLKGVRAVMVAQAPSNSRVSVRLRDVPPDRRKPLMQALTNQLGDVELVGPGAFARFVVDVLGDTVRIFGADGLAEVASLRLADAGWPDQFATVVSRSVTATELMTLNNPVSQISVEARVVTGTQGPPRIPALVGQRGVQVVADLESSKYRIRKAGEPRTPENSLQLDIRTNVEGFLTVVDVDSQGAINLLFPNSYQNQTFYPDGRITAGQAVLIPDSLETGNRAGFHWDYSPPPGQDTIRVFVSTDLGTARMIRQQIKRANEQMKVAQGPRPQIGASKKKRAVTTKNKLGKLRQNLCRVATRGLAVVADEPEGAVSDSGVSAPQMSGQVSDLSDSSASTEPTEPGEAGTVENVVSPGQSGTPPAQTQVVADWAATSVSIVVRP